MFFKGLKGTGANFLKAIRVALSSQIHLKGSNQTDFKEPNVL